MTRTGLLGCVVVMGGCGLASAGENTAGLLTAERLGAIHKLISPSDRESLFRTIFWHTDLWEARRVAAAEGKPIFIWAGSGGGPVGVC